MDSCCKELFSSSSFNLPNSASRFRFNSICVAVALPDSSSLAAMSSSSLVRIWRLFSALALVPLSISRSSSSSSMRLWNLRNG